jgi:hypothetical protein
VVKKEKLQDSTTETQSFTEKHREYWPRFAFARRRSIIFLAIASYQIPAEFADLD